jgi:hypothetical protein
MIAIFIRTWSDKLNEELVKLGCYNASLAYEQFDTTTVRIANQPDEDFMPTFFNGFGKPKYVTEVQTEQEFLELVKLNLK